MAIGERVRSLAVLRRDRNPAISLEDSLIAGVLRGLLRAWRVPLAVIGAVLLLGACENRGSGTSKDVMRAVVTVPALAGVVGPLLPEGAELTILMKPGRSEHGYEFTPTDIAALGRADLVVYVGLGLEPKVEAFVRKRGNERRRAVCFAEAVGLQTKGEEAHGHDHDGHGHDHGHGSENTDKILPRREDAAPHPQARRGMNESEAGDHGDHDGHDHGPVDPHLWLDPVMVERLVPAVASEVEAVLKRRGELDEAAKARLAGAAEKVVAEVTKVDAEYRERLGAIPEARRAIVTHHAAFGRLAERYGLRVVEVIRPIEGVEPTPGQIAEVAEAVKKEGVSVIFVEPQFNAAAAERLAASVGVKVGTLDPLGDGDWFKMMRGNLEELVGKLGSAGP